MASLTEDLGNMVDESQSEEDTNRMRLRMPSSGAEPQWLIQRPRQAPRLRAWWRRGARIVGPVIAAAAADQRRLLSNFPRPYTW